MAIGKLQFQLYIGEEALPVTDAEIFIIEKEFGMPLELEPIKTDISGKTREIELYTYDKALSQVPEDVIKPYITYDAIIVSNSFRNVIIKDIPIFDGITSIEKVQMYPKVRGSDGFEEIDIPDNGLLVTKNPQPIDGETNGESAKPSPKVLNKVVIPEYITVHLGTPTSNASNVTVLFTDYVKNVASSEIYPTWPEEALKANIYAIISFTLNRIYTEWYRSRGYNFDITNSTAYDHYFVNGRNIFDTISKAVDDIFSEYMSRKNFAEPLLAQYCNGTTVTCAGMSQWGTVDYANAGNTAFQILTKYYGNNIELRNADLVQGIPQSYPGKALKLGSSGEDVKTIQRQLNRIGKNYPAIPKINPEDGYFNSVTEEAVKVFQKIFNLTQDGIVGKSTWNKLSQIYVGVKNLAELESEGEKLPIPEEPPTTLLKLGAKGDAVKVAQYFLACIAYFYDKVLPVKITGNFDKTTEDSVKSFQQLFNLSADGIIGPLTWNKLYEIYKTIEPYILTASGQLPTYPGYIIKQGQRGNDVKTIQNWLATISKKYYNIPYIDADGIFGSKTKEAVIAFQKLFGLDPDGLVGPLTWNKIYEVYSKVIKENIK